MDTLGQATPLAAVPPHGTAPTCFLIGADTLLTLCGDALLRQGFAVRGVITAAGRVRAWAEAASLPVLDLHGPFADTLREAPFDYLLAITHLALLPGDVVALPRVAAINFHDGPLPRYAGLNAPVWALIAGEARHGVTWHRMTAGIDDGGILAQELFDVAPDETALSLNTRCLEAGLAAFERLLPQLASRQLVEAPQDRSQRSYFGRDQRPSALGVLDWRRPAARLEALVRALDFGAYRNPLTCPKLLRGGRAVAVVKARVDDTTARALPGTVLAADADALRIAAGAGTLAVIEGQTLGGQPLTPAEIAARLTLAPGDRLDELGDAQVERFDLLGKELARAEAKLVDRLASLATVELPQASAGAEAPPAATARACPLLRAHGKPALLAAFAAYVARVTGHATFDLAHGSQALADRLAGLEGIVSTLVPVRIELDLEAPLLAAQAAVAAALERARTAFTFAHDLVARHPDLRRGTTLAAGHLLPLAILERAQPADAALPPGAQLALVLQPAGEEACWLYDPRALSEAALDGVERALAALLAVAAAAPERPLARLSLLAADERERVLRGFNRTALEQTREGCVHQQIEAQAARTPQAIAVVCGAETLTYAELDRRAGCLATRLARLGIGPDRLVGIHLERSVELVVAVLGVLKAGGAYVPLDPSYPQERIRLMLEDSGAPVLLTTAALLPELPPTRATVLCVERDPGDARPSTSADVAPHHLAYAIYTSGSTGRPKGVLVEHRNVVAFFAGMDQRLGEASVTWLAVTSLSFDIAVLELLWTAARGCTVVMYQGDRSAAAALASAGEPLPLGLFLWGNDDGPGAQKYRLMLEAARFADSHGFAAVWTPERHFHAFGGPFPNPSVTSAAIAAVTRRVQIRAGSVVSPLHHPLRIAEEWAVVDNLSDGRVGLAFASGWMPDDFVLRREAYADHKQAMLRSVDTVRRLWRGEKLQFEGPMGPVEVSTLPRPVQPELPVWITTAGNPETWRQAGEAGANLLTHLLGQSVAELADKVQVYREARARAGHDPDAGVVTLMLHTLVGQSDEAVRALVRGPMKEYLGASLALVKQYAWAFPAFKRPQGMAQDAIAADLSGLTAEERDTILEHAFLRYFQDSGLFGAVDTCVAMLHRVAAAGVDEVACLIDFGVKTDTVLEGLRLLDDVRQRAPRRQRPARAPAEGASSAGSVAELILHHKVTHLQCTPSRARLLLGEPRGAEALAALEHLLVGGEALPPALAQELRRRLRGRVTNMYGPTETTVWSTTHAVAGDGRPEPIGTPIANTACYVLDAGREPLPIGVPGELWIGGAGVVRGYLDRPALTAERFVADPFQGAGARMYRTGDVARWRSDGVLEFLGRADQQVKLRGYRVELGEIEARLGALPAVREAAVVVHAGPEGDQRLVAYVVARGGQPDAGELQRALGSVLPEFMVPSVWVWLDRLPLTPNGKIDRKALPAPRPATAASFAAPDGELEGRLAAAFQGVLRVPRVSARDNFFQVGGHSLLAIQLHRELHQHWPQLALTDLYRFPTVQALAAHLAGDACGKGSQQGTERAARRRAARARAIG